MESREFLAGVAPSDVQNAQEEARRQLDGIDRVALLPRAQMLAISFGAIDEPAYVFIEWTPGEPEGPYPGTTIWRAVIERWLRMPHEDNPSWPLLAPIAEANLARFTSLNAWIRWCDRERERRRDAVDRPTRTPPTAGHLWPW